MKRGEKIFFEHIFCDFDVFMSHGKFATCVRATSELRTENVNECKIGLKSEKFGALQRIPCSCYYNNFTSPASK